MPESTSVSMTISSTIAEYTVRESSSAQHHWASFRKSAAGSRYFICMVTKSMGRMKRAVGIRKKYSSISLPDTRKLNTR